MNLKFVPGLAFSALLVFSSVQAATPSAEEVVRKTTDQVVARLVDQKSELEAHPERIYDLIHELVIPHFDFASMSKWVLGKSWKGASPSQRDAFISQFRTLLVRTYAKALLEYSEEVIRFLPVEDNPSSNLVLVKTEVEQSAGSAPIPIQYRLHISDGSWKVVDVAVDGVSLVSTYRGSFASDIQREGLDALIGKLTERNSKLVISSETQPATASP
ncbi:MAG: ABC transporter substrate-binding protein [Gammaproteobacteria bacterium]|nr:ABC transporter substrate-binding protein [Gammaproteobacteria bacterium]